MRQFLFAKFAEVVRAIAPLIGAVCFLQFVLVHAPIAQFVQFLVGSVLAVIGMMLLFAGIEHGILPMGRYIGAELPRTRSTARMLAVTAAIAYVTTVAEPDVMILSSQIDRVTGGGISGRALAYLIALGVGIFAAIAIWAIARGRDTTGLLAVAFTLMVVLALFADPKMIPLSFDAGSVTTGVLSSPVLLALGLGVSAVLARHARGLDGFGLLGLASTGPVIVLLLLACMG
jgi:hypothetical protein